MNTRRYAHLLLLLLVTPLSAIAQTSRITDDIVKIGVMTDLSGAYSDLSGQGSVQAAKMAIQDFSKDGTVLGKRIELITADHQNKPDVASSKAREWYDRDKVDVIVDLPNSSTTLAVMDVAGAKQKMVLVSSGASLAVSNERCNAYTVQWTYDFYPLYSSLPRQLVKAGKKKWFIVAVDYSSGVYMTEKVTAEVRAAGGEIVGTAVHPLGASDFSSYLVKAQASKADVVALANSGVDAINSIKTAAEFGITGGKQTIVPMLMFLTDVHTLGLEKMQRMNLIEAFYWDRDDRSRAWSRRFFAERKRMPNMVHAGVYSAVLNYLKAIQTAGTDDAALVMKVLKSTTIDDGLFKGTIRADGRFIHDMYLVEVKKPSESTAPWDYYKIKSVIPGETAAQPLSESKCPLVAK